MSWRHTHITSFLGGHPEEEIARFVAVAEEMFLAVVPVRNERGAVIAVAMYGKDLDNVSEQLAMPERVEKLSGILTYRITIASAWGSEIGWENKTRPTVSNVPPRQPM